MFVRIDTSSIVLLESTHEENLLKCEQSFLYATRIRKQQFTNDIIDLFAAFGYYVPPFKGTQLSFPS